MIAATQDICDQIVDGEVSGAKSGYGTIQALSFGKQGMRLVFPNIDRWIQGYGNGIIPAYERAFSDAFEHICNQRINTGKEALHAAKANPPETHQQLTPPRSDFNFYKYFYDMQTETDFWAEQRKWFGKGLPVHAYNLEGTIDIVLSQEKWTSLRS